jgi:hypothetical protein
MAWRGGPFTTTGDMAVFVGATVEPLLKAAMIVATSITMFFILVIPQYSLQSVVSITLLL